MRAIFMGTPDISVPVLTAMVEAGHEVVAVITQPDKPKGRGKEIQMTPVKIKALEYGIPVLQPVKVRDPEFIEELKTYHPEVAVVIAFGQILTKEVLEIPTHGCINVHASLLPMYRGAAPIQQTILDGCQETGVTTMYMDEGLDTGDMLLKKVVPIEDTETGGSLHDKIGEAGAELLVETLKQLEAGTLTRTPQTGKTCYVGMIKKSMGEIDWTKPAVVIERQIRGLNPWPSAYTHFQGKTLKLWSASVEPDTESAKTDTESVEQDTEPAAPGTIVKVEKNAVYVKTGEGTLKILELQLEGKKRMAADAFLRGYSMNVGEKLGVQ